MLLQTVVLQLDPTLYRKHTEKQYSRPGIRLLYSFIPRACTSWGGRDEAKGQRSQIEGGEGKGRKEWEFCKPTIFSKVSLVLTTSWRCSSW